MTTVDDAVAAYVQGRIGREELVAALVRAGESAVGAEGYARVLDAQARDPSTVVGNIYPTIGPAESQPLTEAEVALIAATAARILPTTDSPGATEAGAAAYVQRALATDYRPLRGRYHQGLAALDAYCLAEMGAPFVQLPAATQDVVLRDLAAGTLAASGVDADFFALLRDHVLEGVFGEPQYGGNREMIGWRLVGFPGQRTGYPDAYLNRVIDLPPVVPDEPRREE